jgi:hypothetical protein
MDAGTEVIDPEADGMRQGNHPRIREIRGPTHGMLVESDSRAAIRIAIPG